jgi:hypothetical protein
MRLRQTITSIFILALFFSLAAGLNAVKADSQFPPFTGILHVESPINRTYTTGFLILNVSFSSLLGANINHSLTYSLDGRFMGAMPIKFHDPQRLTFQGFFTATVALPELSRGFHTITVYGEHNFWTNDVFRSKITQVDNVTVDFSISDVIPVNELTPPTISDLTIENKTYSSAKLQLGFNVDKAVLWTGYCLDGERHTIAEWYRINASDRKFNATLEGLSEGSHSLAVYAEDTFGNTGASITVNFGIDTIPPAISILSVQNRTYDTATIPLTFGVNESAIKIEYGLDGQNKITINGNSTLTDVPNGDHNLTVYATDKAGNIGVSETVSFSIDAPEPFPVIIVATVAVTAAFIAIALLFYFKKRKHPH